MTRALPMMLLLWVAGILVVPSTLALDVSTPPAPIDVGTADSASVSFEHEANTSAGVQPHVSFGGPLDAGSPASQLSVASTDDAAARGNARAVGVAAVSTAAGLGILVLVLGWLHVGGAAGLGLFSRINSHHILDNDARRRVHEAILANPGITIKEVATVADLGWGTTVYHLARLEDEKLVSSERHRQFRRYYQNGGDLAKASKTGHSELKNPTTQRLAVQVAQCPGVVQRQLCDEVGITAPVAHKHLARLEAANLLTREREWKSVKYFPTQRLHDLLLSATTSPVPA